MIPIAQLPDMASRGDGILYEVLRQLALRAVQDDFTIASTSPLTVNGVTGGSAPLFSTPLTIGLSIPLTPVFGGTGTATAFTPGSVIFAGAGGVYAQDNASIFWDNVNKRLGLGTPLPSRTFHVVSGTAGSGVAVTTTDWSNGATGSIIEIGLGAATGNTYSSIVALSTGGSLSNNLILQLTGGRVGVITTAPGTTFDVGTSVAHLIRAYGGFTGNSAANIDGTGAAAYFPNGLYIPSGTSWLYGSINFNGSIHATAATTIEPANFNWGANTTLDAASGARGLVPPSPGGTTTFLRSDCTWTTVATTTNNYAARAYNGGTAQTLSAATYTKITLPSESFDPGANFDSTTNYRYTAPVAGYYQINGAISFAAAGGSYATIYKNGALAAYGNWSTVANTTVTVSDCLFLAANDYVELFGYSTPGSAINLNGSTAVYFSIVLVHQ